jgi:signal peptidase I
MVICAEHFGDATLQAITQRAAAIMEIIDTQVEELKKLWKNKRQLAFQGLNLAMIVLSALMIWKGLMVVTRSESPVVVVLR